MKVGTKKTSTLSIHQDRRYFCKKNRKYYTWFYKNFYRKFNVNTTNTK